jgi:hypothetical protein
VPRRDAARVYPDNTYGGRSVGAWVEGEPEKSIWTEIKLKGRKSVFYLLFGFAIVAVPAITDRLLNGRVTTGWRFALGLHAVALTGAMAVVIARLLAIPLAG